MDSNPWTHLQNSLWKHDSSNCFSNARPPDMRNQSTNSVVFPTYTNPYGCAFSGNGAILPHPYFAAHNFLQTSAAFITPPNLTDLPSELTAPQRRFMVFDRTGNQTKLIFSSAGPPRPVLDPVKPKACQTGYSSEVLLPQSNETDVDNARDTEEIHEDTEEINALLYDSDEDCETEEVSTGHSPLDIKASLEEVASSSLMPAKRRRIDTGLDASLTDTASSAGSHHHESLDDELSCVNECESKRGADGNKRKREKIRETVSVLRRIIPGSKGKDAVSVLDEAIQYLKNLKIKAKFKGASL